MASDQSFSKTVSLGEEALNNLSSEVDWYGFETRVRHLLKDAIAPTVKRMADTKDMVEKATNQNDFLKRRIEEIEFILHKPHKRNLVFDDLDKRLGTLENKVITWITNSSTTFEQLKFQGNLVGDRVQTLEGQHVNMKSDVEGLEEKLQKIRVEVNRTTNSKIKDFKNEIRDSLTKLNDFNSYLTKVEND